MDPLLDCVVLEPGRPADRAVIWLHGLGASGHDFPPVVPELGLPKGHTVRFVFPHAPAIPVTLNNGMVMPAWFDIVGMDFESRRADESGVRLSAERLTALIAREVERGVPTERIVLAGFSQGGAIAIHTGVRSTDKLAGILALSTFIAADANIDSEHTPINQDIPILQCHGTEDPMVGMDKGLAARDRLTGLGYTVDWKTYPMQHQVCMEEIQDIGTWLKRVLEL